MNTPRPMSLVVLILLCSRAAWWLERPTPLRRAYDEIRMGMPAREAQKLIADAVGRNHFEPSSVPPGMAGGVGWGDYDEGTIDVDYDTQGRVNHKLYMSPWRWLLYKQKWYTKRIGPIMGIGPEPLALWEGTRGW